MPPHTSHLRPGHLFHTTSHYIKAQKQSPNDASKRVVWASGIFFFKLTHNTEHTYDYSYVCSTNFFSFVGSLNAPTSNRTRVQPTNTCHLTPTSAPATTTNRYLTPTPATTRSTTNHHLTPTSHLPQPRPPPPTVTSKPKEKAQTTCLNASFGLQVFSFLNPPTTPNTRTIICTCVRLIFSLLWLP
jgi:hypothetical protein